MRRVFAVFSLAVLLAVPFSVSAAPTDPATAIALKSDGGPPEPVTLALNQSFELQCKSQACAKFYRDDGGTFTADCATTGFILPSVAPTGVVVDRFVTSYKFNSANANRLLVAALDGGEPGCYLYNDPQPIRH